ncbi:WcaF family extracellular polysaccharide biosynthesis acetyltransferase [Subsaxibacter sp. CAU 1640]|uniref:WcaF family extracellular polysaccharide biosynthesis acetyltransferase n=1 Tax=Subsaxibacter sp. CAU 1640 TaxID=2933271 RepID=UPI0020034760|nr:WcaF family extracellular polysaccharide biosynthesis acetyltransferase [Subsaxibacter sp. CAU 1640]MCK7590220.1 WcaF family extracellular polysaccharide biosynthesis acetyltransferase [Subsaxibacter sp. CAU 1640]
MKTDLSSYNNDWYQPGSAIKRFGWYFINELILRNPLNPSSGLKIFFLRLFGATIGHNVIIKPKVNIKYPWKLVVGDNCWIGESVWIDNLADVSIENNVCLSQGAFLICGNHNYKKPSFDLMVAPIVLKEGAWIGAKSIVGPGVTVESHAVLSLGSVVSSNLDSYSIYKGNPAMKIKTRTIS